MPVISHRGAKGLAPENTIESLKIADSYRPQFIEFDVRLTRDGVAILAHDSKIKGKFIDHEYFSSLLEIQPSLVKLTDAIKTISHSTPLVEIKDPDSAQILIDDFPKKMHYTTFIESEMLVFTKNESNFFAMQRYHPFGLIKKALKYKAMGIGINKNWLFLLPLIYIKAHRNNLDLYIYTLNNRILASFIKIFFPAVYICTDYPDKII